MIARIRQFFLHRAALRDLEDHRRLNEMLIGRAYAKRRAAQLNARSRRTYADGIDGWFARGGK